MNALPPALRFKPDPALPEEERIQQWLENLRYDFKQKNTIKTAMIISQGYQFLAELRARQMISRIRQLRA